MLDDLDDLSLEELLELRESILEQKKNLTYYIEESDDDDDDDDDEEDEEYNSAANEEISDQLEALTHAKGEITDDVVD